MICGKNHNKESGHMAYENIGKETEQVEFKKSTGELKEGVI